MNREREVTEFEITKAQSQILQLEEELHQSKTKNIELTNTVVNFQRQASVIGEEKEELSRTIEKNAALQSKTDKIIQQLEEEHKQNRKELENLRKRLEKRSQSISLPVHRS